MGEHNYGRKEAKGLPFQTEYEQSRNCSRSSTSSDPGMTVESASVESASVDVLMLLSWFESSHRMLWLAWFPSVVIVMLVTDLPVELAEMKACRHMHTKQCNTLRTQMLCMYSSASVC
jgi:hypothetical protein